MVAVGWRKTHAWCAYFAELVWKEAYKAVGIDKFRELDMIFSGSVLNTLSNFKKKVYKIKDKPSIGDIGFMQNGRTSFGHMLVVIGIQGDNIITVEGNTDSGGSREGIEVAEKIRSSKIQPKSKGLHLLGFISPI